MKYKFLKCTRPIDDLIKKGHYYVVFKHHFSDNKCRIVINVAGFQLVTGCWSEFE